MNVWLLWTLYCATLSRVTDGQSVVNNDQPSDETQRVAGLLDNMMQLLYKQQQQTRQLVQAQTQVSAKFDRQNEVTAQLNQTMERLLGEFAQQSEHFNRNLNQSEGRLHEKLAEQSQHFRHTLSRQQGDLANISQTSGQLNEKFHQQSTILQKLKLGFLCSSIPQPTVENAVQSIKQTSNETIITYTCHVGYVFSAGPRTRSTTCNGTSWTNVDGSCIRQCRPVLTHVIRGDTSVYALTSFNNQLFVTRYNRPIAVYDTTTFEWIRNITVSGAGSQLFGLVPCPAGNCLYVSDIKNRKVHKVNLSPTPSSNTPVTTTSWSVNGDPWGLSINRQQNLLVAYYSGKKIAEYTSSGSLVREISDSNYLVHAVEHVVNGTLVVSRSGPVHGVALTTVDGRVLHSYGNTTQGSEPGLMNYPRGLAVDRDGFVLVAEKYNNRIIVLNPTLSDARPLPLPTDANGQALNGPHGLWLDESRGRLYVGEERSPYRVFVYDNVFNVGTLFTP